jgi:hypothetical protein
VAIFNSAEWYAMQWRRIEIRARKGGDFEWSNFANQCADQLEKGNENFWFQGIVSGTIPAGLL